MTSKVRLDAQHTPCSRLYEQHQLLLSRIYDYIVGTNTIESVSLRLAPFFSLSLWWRQTNSIRYSLAASPVNSILKTVSAFLPADTVDPPM